MMKRLLQRLLAQVPRWGVLRCWIVMLACDAAAVAPAMALLLIPVAGASAVGVEESEWYYFQRSMQHAADSAAIAAATNNNTSGTGSGYVTEAAAVARNFGYVNGANTNSVATARATCPANSPAGASCFTTTISTVVPLGFSGLIGFHGNAAYGSGRGELISASATATTATTAGGNYCMWSQSSDSDSFTSYGSSTNLNGCAVMSNGGSNCSGGAINAKYGDAHGTNSGCGTTQTSSTAIPPDNSTKYKGLAGNIPQDSCYGYYPQEQTSWNGSKWTGSNNQLWGTPSWNGGNHEFCGDVQLTGDVTLTGSQTAITIMNGVLDTNGHTIKTASGAAATIVFSGNKSGCGHTPTGTGTIDIAAPTSGNWQGVAIYQDPATTSGVDVNYDDCTCPHWKVSGLVYLPCSNLTFTGTIEKSSNGGACVMVMAAKVHCGGGQISGNVNANSDCGSAGSGAGVTGLAPPVSPSATARVRLVA